MRLLIALVIASTIIGQVCHADDATDYLIKRLSEAELSSKIKITESLISRASKDRAGLVGKEPVIAKNLASEDSNLVAATVRLLGKICTGKAQGAIIDSWYSKPQSMLQTAAQFRLWSKEPLYYWYLSGIGNCDSDVSVKFLVEVAADERNTDLMRAQALNQLVYSNNKDKRSYYSDDLFAIATQLEQSNEKGVSENALKFIGDF